MTDEIADAERAVAQGALAVERNRRRLRLAGFVSAVLVMGATFFAGAAYALSGDIVWLILGSGWTTIAAFLVGFVLGRTT